MFCQTCGTFNSDPEIEFCGRCRSKLLVVSGSSPAEEASGEDTGLDEHLLERISTLEEIVRREGEMVRTLYESFRRLEKSLSVAQTGIEALQETLEQRGIVTAGETADRWRARTEERLHAVEAKDRLLDRRDRIIAGFSSGDRAAFDLRLREAELAIFSLDLDGGVRHLEEAYRLDRGNADLGFFLAESHFAEGDLDRASHFLKKVLAIHPEHYESLLYTGIVASEVGDPRSAEQFLKRAIEIRADGFLPHFALGSLYGRQGRLEEACAELSSARDIAPLPAARVLLGQIERERGDLAAAVEEFELAVATDPLCEEAHFQLGLAYLEKNRPRRALEAFQRALEINPRRLEVQEAVRLLGKRDGHNLPGVTGPAADNFRLAERSVSLGRYGQALEFYRRALAEDPENGTLRISYAQLCAAQGLTREAVAICRKILAGRAEEMIASAACSTLAEILRADGHPKDAARAVREFLSGHDSPTARTIGFYELASSLAESEENLGEALDCASRSLEAAPDELKHFALAAMGWVYYKKTDYVSAIDFLRRSSEAAAMPSTLHRLGLAYLAAGRPDEAKTAFKKAKTVSSRGMALDERILEQVRSNQRLVNLFSSRRRA